MAPLSPLALPRRVGEVFRTSRLEVLIPPGSRCYQRSLHGLEGLRFRSTTEIEEAAVQNVAVQGASGLAVRRAEWQSHREPHLLLGPGRGHRAVQHVPHRSEQGVAIVVLGEKLVVLQVVVEGSGEIKRILGTFDLVKVLVVKELQDRVEVERRYKSGKTGMALSAGQPGLPRLHNAYRLKS
eukprot:scaffold8062_cov286-Pinguiococcus_pyrenoidosus.AAC.1